MTSANFALSHATEYQHHEVKTLVTDLPLDSSEQLQYKLIGIVNVHSSAVIGVVK